MGTPVESALRYFEKKNLLIMINLALAAQKMILIDKYRKDFRCRIITAFCMVVT